MTADQPAQAVPLRCALRPETLREIRAAVRSYAGTAGLSDPALYNFVLAVNELLTNALRHAGGRGDVLLWRTGDRLFCEVSDEGPGMPAERLSDTARPGAATIGGRGLWLARQVCDRVDIRTGPTGSQVRLEHHLPVAA